MATKLFAVSADAKTVKGQKQGILTGVLYLAPFNVSGYQVCPKSTEGCRASCLFTAGRGIYQKTRNGRIRKTKMFFEQRAEFMALLYKDIQTVMRKAKRMNMEPVIRLNGTSDIPWEKISFEYNDIKYPNIMTAFPEIQFYDYGKYMRKAINNISNYHFTFSLSESNDADALKALAKGFNVAVVVNTKRKETKPKTFSGYPAIDGDTNDIRFLDASGSIVLLTAKGKARYDKSGFVKSLDYRIKDK